VTPTRQSLFSSAKKVTKNAVSLRRSLTTTGASRSVFCPAVSERLSPSGIGGTFFVLHLHQALCPTFPSSEIVVILCLPPFERHTELNSKNRPLGMIFTCSKIKRSLLNLFVVAALCFEKICGIRMILAGCELRY